MRLTTAEIDRYGPLYDWRPPCQDGLTVISGPNEAGKTLYLEALLQLLDPDVEDVMEPPPRISQTPTGRVIVEHGGEQYECDGDVSLGDITAIEPAHLQSVFVVRDNDLQLPSGQAYYTSLIEKLGDIHTTEINRIKSSLKDRGRLTSRRLNISSDRRYDNAGDVRDEARTLAAEIRAYTATIEAEGLDELDARRLRLTRQRRTARDHLRAQEKAQTVDDYEHLSGQLDTYRTTSAQLADLTAFDRDTLDELRTIRNDLERDRADLQALETEIEETEAEVERTAETLRDRRDELSALERREDAVSDARSALSTYRDQQDAATGADHRLGLAKPVTVAGLLAAGSAGIVGAITGSIAAIGLGVGLLFVAVLGGVVSYRTSQHLAAVESARATALQAGRDAGLDVETVDDVAPAIEAFEQDLATVRDRVTRTEQEHKSSQEDLASLREEKSTLTDRITDQEDTLDAGLDEAGVETIEAFEQHVERREALRPQQQTARQSLVDRFGEPDGEDPEANARVWAADLDALVDDIDLAAVDAAAYDAAELQRLEDEVGRLEREVAELEAQLDAHDDQLDAFDQRARELDTRTFIGRSVSLDARSKAGLDALAADLDEVVAQIEADAEVSRKALDVFEQIEQQEEQKLTDLFAPDGPASSTFAQLTGGRYTEVAYDAAAHDLVVERRDGRTFSPAVLSHGTQDQLYFATRVSLAQQLLGTEPGFFLLDDPFLTADPERLRRGFDTLQDLADAGWQILYLTAKQEVSETMVDAYDLDHVPMEALSLGTTRQAQRDGH